MGLPGPFSPNILPLPGVISFKYRDMDIKNTRQFGSLKNVSLNKQEARHKLWIGSYFFLGLAFLTAWFLLRLDVFNVFGGYKITLQKISLAACIATLILMIARFVEMTLVKRSHTVYTRYNLVRMVRLLSWIAIAGVAISFLFKNWYSAAVSLGLISLILGFALQTPISSFIGWLYILIRQPYHVGDRIQIDVFKGDVVEVSYLDTTLWEFSGDYLTNDMPSGRLIRFPNSLVLQSAVYNYSWEKFPFIWNEIPFHFAYESDLKFVEDTLRNVTKQELGDKMADNVEQFKRILEQTPVEELDIKEYPYVTFKINANTWVEAIVTYLVEPKKAAGVRTNLVKKILEALKQEPDKAMFPKSNSR